jgi:DNA polymerase III delta prime subunit
MQLIKIKHIKHIGILPALNISMKKNQNFLLENGILTHNTKISQEALRNIMETYSSNVFFLLSCNNINRVIEPIKSRCVVISFAYPSKSEIREYLIKICINEKMQFTNEGIDTVIEMNYPSIRNCVISLQDLFTEGLPVVKENVRPINEVFVVLWEKLKQKEWKDIKQVVMASTIDPRELNTYFWECALRESDVKLIQLCCRNERDFAIGADPKVIMISSLIDMVR